MKSSYPLISCICITNNRPELLKKAIACFESQNYPNKELVISFPKNDRFTKGVIEQALTGNSIRIYQIVRQVTNSLGEARNEAIAKCTGDFVCIWDDNDWYHGSRLTYQFNSMQSLGHGYKASILTRILLYDFTTKQAYLSSPYPWDGSILCRREILIQNQYSNNEKGEDEQVMQFLSARKLLCQIEEVPFLYIYVYHGDNTWNYDHFEYFLKKSELLDENVTQNIRNLLL